MWALRFGSYSMRSTLAAMPSLLRLKSRRGSAAHDHHLAVVMRPLLFAARLAVLLLDQGASGLPLCRTGR